MRILLVGEYSGFHNSLKHGLELLGHEVTIIGDGDGFKQYPVDINIGTHFFEKNWLRHKIKVAWWKLSGQNLEDHFKYARFTSTALGTSRESEKQLKDYDIVQFINSNPFNCNPKTERKMIEALIQNQARFFLVACGDDYEYAQYLTEEHQGYSILDAFHKGEKPKETFSYTYKYLEPAYRDNYERIVGIAEAIIPSNIDYAMALTLQPKAIPIIPAAINCGKYQLNLNTDFSKIQIFLGINRGNYWKKGISYFEKALEQIQAKYPDRVQINITENLAYDQYIKQFANAHILLDQVLCYDQGYNALEAMLQGKVVFTGGSAVYLEAHGLKEIPVINAQPDVEYLVGALADLIENPEKIIALGRAARNHVLEHHDSLKIALQYEALYKANQTESSHKD